VRRQLRNFPGSGVALLAVLSLTAVAGLTDAGCGLFRGAKKFLHHHGDRHRRNTTALTTVLLQSTKRSAPRGAGEVCIDL